MHDFFHARRFTRFGADHVLGSLMVELLILVAAGWAFGTILQDVLAKAVLSRLDRPMAQLLVEHRTRWLTMTLRAGTQLGSLTVLVPLTAIVGMLGYRRAWSWRPLLLLGSALSGSVALSSIVKVLVGRPRPHVGAVIATANGYSFPSGHVTQSVAVYGALSMLATPLLTGARERVTAWLVASLIVALIAFSRLYLGVHWATDVLGGFALGSAWLVAVATATEQTGAGRDSVSRCSAQIRHGAQ